MVEQTDFFDQQHRQPPPVVNFPGAPQPQPARPAPPPPQQRHLFTEPVQQVTPQYVATAKVVAQILATRVLLMIAVVTASGVWAFTIYDPLQLRIIAASAFSVLGVLPLIWLYFRKG